MLSVRDFPLLSDQVDYNEIGVIVAELSRVLTNATPGDVVELGCYSGTTSVFLQRCLAGTAKQLHVYDSFSGLPPKTAPDESPAGSQFIAGELSASKKQFIANFKRSHLPLPRIHKGWFSDLSADDIPASICFAFLDGDYYESIMDSLKLIWPRLEKGSVVIVDDYQSEALPGARRAVDEWLKTHSVSKLSVLHSLAVIHR